MTARLRAIWLAVNASYWFYPALAALLALLLSAITVHLDHNGASDWLARFGAIIPARPQGASNLLTVISGSMIGVASTVFSITIAAVAYASGNYGPRLLTNFMEDRGNQLSLAAFIGTFTYALFILRTVRAPGEAVAGGGPSQAGFVPQLSLLVAMGLMGLSIATLVYFLNHIPSSIRINTVLEGIGRRLLDMVDDMFPEPCRETVGEPPAHFFPVAATGTGYIQVIEWGALDDAVEDAGRRFSLSLRAGDFVHPGVELGRLDGPAGDDALDRIRGAFALGATRTPAQDLQFLIDELVEIALRALSPGINDPFTAITAIHWLGAATALFGQRDLNRRIGGETKDRDAIAPLNDRFDHYLYRGFGAARGSIASSKLVTMMTFEALQNAALPLDSAARREAIREEGRLLFEQARLALQGPELDEVRARAEAFDKALAPA
ncbi:DUF2254 domain-containing protein [Novosphingobium sp. ZN18A2]|uniref:DUF2254 domain-containing protein n=1 Tax=Novosphingobium sp. ZN18A2 TaxID=3079861 RepID=UPI0030CC114F